MSAIQGLLKYWSKWEDSLNCPLYRGCLLLRGIRLVGFHCNLLPVAPSGVFHLSFHMHTQWAEYIHEILLPNWRIRSTGQFFHPLPLPSFPPLPSSSSAFHLFSPPASLSFSSLAFFPPLLLSLSLLLLYPSSPFPPSPLSFQSPSPSFLSFSSPHLTFFPLLPLPSLPPLSSPPSSSAGVSTVAITKGTSRHKKAGILTHRTAFPLILLGCLNGM